MNKYLTLSQPPRLLHQCIYSFREKTPEQVAIHDDDLELTYSELCKQVDSLAKQLQDIGIQPNDRIGVFSQNSIESTLAIFAAMRADGCYVAINPDFPEDKILDIIIDSGCQTVLIEARYQEVFTNLLKNNSVPILKNVITLNKKQEFSQEFIEDVTLKKITLNFYEEWFELTNPAPEKNTPQDLCYIMYTSGTTGKPKGVMLMHKNVVHFANWIAKGFDLEHGLRWAHHSRISFDLSVLDIFGCYFTGGTLYPIKNKGDISFPGSFVEKYKINVWISVPSSLNMMIRSGQMTENSFSSHLKIGFFCGELLNTDIASHWLKTHPEAKLINMYGPTEAAVACTAHQVSKKDLSEKTFNIPIGNTSPTTELLILNKTSDTLCKPEEIGRLMIAGGQVAAGYWNKEDLTKERFVPHTFKHAWYRKMYDTGDLAFYSKEGHLHYVGREDQQVQVMGFRVELTEIESALYQSPLCSELSVIFEPDQQQLILAAVLKDEYDEKLAKKELFKFAKSKLAEHMVPKKTIFYAELPKNINGKIDRKQILMDYLKSK